MSGSVRHFNVKSILAIHSEVLSAHGGTPGLRSRELLESAVAAPQATAGGKPLIADRWEIAAAYLYYLCSNHPFVDGNKRVALAACLVFLSKHGLLADTKLDTDSWERFVLEVAAGARSREETASRLRELLEVG